jgi:uncharacterized membrane protein SirB2
VERYYGLVWPIHVCAVAASGTLFFLRGLALICGASWPRARWARRISDMVDTVLLAAALTLTAIIGQYPFVDAWLTAKVVLLLLYIGLGVIVFRFARNTMQRLVAWLAAVAVYGFIASIAVTHNPGGVFSLL